MYIILRFRCLWVVHFVLTDEIRLITALFLQINHPHQCPDKRHRSRANMIDAPHMSKNTWGLSDLYAAEQLWVIDIPDKNFKSPFTFVHKREPNVRAMHYHIWGAPIEFKRAPVFLGGGGAIPADGNRCPAPISGPEPSPPVWGPPRGLLRG